MQLRVTYIWISQHGNLSCHTAPVTCVVSSCGQTVSVVWVSYKRLWLVYLSLYERHDRRTDDDLLNFVGPPLPSGKYLTYLINIITPSHRLYVKHLRDKGTKMFGMFTSWRDVKRYSKWDQNTTTSHSSTSAIVFVNLRHYRQTKTKNNSCLHDKTLLLYFHLYPKRSVAVTHFHYVLLGLDWAKGLYKNYWGAEAGRILFYFIKKIKALYSIINISLDPPSELEHSTEGSLCHVISQSHHKNTLNVSWVHQKQLISK